MRRLVAVAAVAGPLLYLRRRDARRERVEIRFEDGSAVTLDRGAVGDRLLAVARQAL